MPQAFGRPYQPAKTTFFSQSVNTACGQADSGVGPFYCPEDDKIYIDLTFYNELATRFGAKGEFAQPYVLAHEYGHHIQDLLGTEAQMRRAQERDPGNANTYSVMLELQADCYSVTWTKHAVGDDAIQKKVSGRVDEHKFTHGTSEQRQHWFSQGYQTGDPRSCDTFGNAL